MIVVDRTEDQLHVLAESHVEHAVCFVEDCDLDVGRVERLAAEVVEKSAREEGIPVVRGGVYLAMEGPQFSSLAESHLYRSWGCDVIGMTNMPEAKLAREAELCYASVAIVTDYDCWHPEHEQVEVADIAAVLTRNADRSRALVSDLARRLAGRAFPCSDGCNTVLDTALITPPEARDPELLAKLDAVAGRLFGGD